MKEIIEIGKIRQALEANKKLATEGDKKLGGYDTSEEEWPTYDSSLENFESDLVFSLPKDYEPNLKEDRFKKYIEETLSKEKNRNLTAVEFGGPGSQLFRDFTKKFFTKTVGVCLKDIRPEDIKKHDVENNHSLIIGDIMEVISNETLEEVAKKLGTNRTDLIISRMKGPLDDINKHPAILDRIIRNWYGMLNDNGLMFIQYDNYMKLEPLVRKWVTAVNQRFPQIDLQPGDGILRLHKRKGSPENLPSVAQFFKIFRLR